jgi:S1-C subfamily serine protease
MMRRFLDRYRMVIAALTGALLAVGIMFIYLDVKPPAGRYDDAQIRALANEQIAKTTPSPPVEPEIFNLVRPSVVAVLRSAPGSNGDPGIGSGVIVDENGNILTAYHVVAGLNQAWVRFVDGSVVVATVDKAQPERDLAVLHVDGLPDAATAATLAGGVQPGDEVMAIGAPFGLEGSLTSGVVSATGRSFVVEETGTVLTNMIQFDAAVNPGNSGGPLVDMTGRVVGIVTGIINPTNMRVFIGLGFAVPIESASGIFPPLG